MKDQPLSTVTGTVSTALVRPKVIYLKLKNINREVVVFRNRGDIYDLAKNVTEGTEITATGIEETDQYAEKLLANALTLCTEKATDTVEQESPAPPVDEVNHLPHDVRSVEGFSHYATMEEFEQAGFIIHGDRARTDRSLKTTYTPMTPPPGSEYENACPEWVYSSKSGTGGIGYI